MQEGGKQDNPDELTSVSDSGDHAQPTHLQLERGKLSPIDFELQEGGKQDNPDELTSVSDSGYRAQPTHLQLER
ncbi:hypothetical protein [Yersinia mollaretii]|uniref:hypothetical protein n=1 Tax=Yersinia mollaretii TaxID=33060 RepID=UPI0011A16EA1|nr:hypothetical protein [Yersinia mollaretii]